MAWLYRFVILLCCHIGKGFHGPTLRREGKGSQCSADTGNIWALKRLDVERLPAFNDGARNLWMNAGARKPNALVCMLLSQHFLGRGGRSLRIRQHFGENDKTQSGDRRLSHAHWQGTFATQCEDRGLHGRAVSSFHQDVLLRVGEHAACCVGKEVSMCDSMFECVLSLLALIVVGASWLLFACWALSLC
jgi:hypothetical protein